MIFKNIFTFFIILLTVFISNTAFGSSGETDQVKNDKNKTISTINTEIKQIEEEKEEILKRNLELKNSLIKNSFFRNKLNKKELERIKMIIDGYKIQQKQYENDLIEKSKNLQVTTNTRFKLINSKKEMYSNLVEYIEAKKLKEYLIFVKKDLITLKENKELEESSIKKNVILTEKVNKIKEKIIKHKKKSQKILKETIVKKIDIKISIFEKSEKFTNLKKDKKIKIINYIINKIDLRIEQMKEIQNKTEILETKIEIYLILKNRFIKIKEEIKL